MTLLLVVLVGVNIVLAFYQHSRNGWAPATCLAVIMVPVTVLALYLRVT